MPCIQSLKSEAVKKMVQVLILHHFPKLFQKLTF